MEEAAGVAAAGGAAAAPSLTTATRITTQTSMASRNSMTLMMLAGDEDVNEITSVPGSDVTRILVDSGSCVHVLPKAPASQAPLSGEAPRTLRNGGNQ